MIVDGYNDFSSKNAMELNGWVFDWDDSYVFVPTSKKDTYCANVPPTSYCGFRHPGDGGISYQFSASGSGKLRYGQSVNYPTASVHVYMNNVEIGSRSTPGTSTLVIRFTPGDVLQIKEHNSVINIHSLCISSGPSPGIH